MPLRESLEVPQPSDRWNHNIHYHRVILDAIPSGCRRALDVGCGEGTLTRQLRQLIPEVVGIDADDASITSARDHPDAGDIQYVEGDALAYEFDPTSFDLITSAASLHHMDAERALIHLRSLLRPGGVLAVIGLARSSPIDWPLDLAAVAANCVRRLRAPVLAAPIAGRMAATGELCIDAADRGARSTRRPFPTPSLLAVHARLDQAVTRFGGARCMSLSALTARSCANTRLPQQEGAARCDDPPDGKA